MFDPLGLSYFAGGPHAGSPPASATNPTNGGGGGGGLILIACRGDATLVSTSTIDLRGGGGEGQYDTTAGAGVIPSNAGAGGGAGGYLVVEGLTALSMTGSIWANGGGGGGGSSDEDTSAPAGQDGQRKNGQALGGVGNVTTGGYGGFRFTNPIAGGGESTGSHGAGGGGSMGIIHIFVPPTVSANVTSTNMSPIPTTKIAKTR